MKHKRMQFGAVRILSLAVVVAGMTLASGISGAAAGAKGYYHQTNLVSDIPGRAQFTDPNLVNAWGLSRSAGSPWWVSDNGTGVSTLYGGDGKQVPLVVTVPPAGGITGTGTPTGQVFNGTGQFVVTSGANSGSAFFIFATEDGTIAGWNPTTGTTAIPEVTQANTVFKGLAIGSVGTANYLYATNFRTAKVNVFDSGYHPATLAGNFVDKRIPAHYAPFGIQNIGGELYVTYAKQDAKKHDDVRGVGHGFVDVYSTSGKLVKRLAGGGVLNSPWGLALAPASFGKFKNALLVGNFGDGRISAFNPTTGHYRGQLAGSKGKPKSIEGLWALGFGNDAKAGSSSTLYFTAGIDGEQHGLFGSITAVPPAV